MREPQSFTGISYFFCFLFMVISLFSVTDSIWSSSNQESLTGNLSSIGIAATRSIKASMGFGGDLTTTRYYPTENFEGKFIYFAHVFSNWLILFLPATFSALLYRRVSSFRRSHLPVMTPFAVFGTLGIIIGLISGAILTGKPRWEGWITGLAAGMIFSILLSKIKALNVAENLYQSRYRNYILLTGSIIPLFIGILLVSLSVKSTRSKNVGPNLVLIVIDTLREDALGLYGSDEASSFFIDRYFSKGIQVKGIRANSSWTAPSFASLFTGEHPKLHHVTGGGNHLPSNMETLAGLLSRQGYFTSALMCNPVVPSAKGFANGFHWYDNRINERKAFHTFQAVQSMIPVLKQHEKFFLLIQFMDCHQPYNPAIRYDGRIIDHLDEKPVKFPSITHAHKNPDTDADSIEVERYHRFYQSGLRNADGAIERILRRFQMEELLANTVIAVTSDHGEEFHDHGSLDHCATLYEEVVRIPFLIRSRGTISQLLDQSAQLSDVGTTLIRHLELKEKLGSGENFLGTEFKERPILLDTRVYGFAVGGVIAGNHKYIAPLKRAEKQPVIHHYYPRPWHSEEIFNLVSDPGEQTHVTVSRDTREKLIQLWDQLNSEKSPQDWDVKQIDSESLDALKELGYIQ